MAGSQSGSSTTLGLFGLCLVVAGYLLYLRALPKPIKGIPYNKHAAKRILGDVPDALAWHKTTSEMFTFLAAQIVEHDSPIIQLFMRPFGRPWVIISDFREAQDICVRRTREFDRSDFFGDLFASSLPANQVHMPTGDTWRSHRKLMNDTMSSSFLNDVLGPQIHSTTLVTIDLWREKVRLAEGRPFYAMSDVYKGALDVTWAATFGKDIGVSRSQLKYLANIPKLETVSSDNDSAVEMPLAPEPEAFKAIMTLSDSTEIPMNSPIPRLHHRLALKFFPSLVAARKAKDQLLTERLDTAWKRFSSGEKRDSDVKCALDFVVQREAILAKKEGRQPAHDTPAVRDELFGFLVAGHETTSTTICWGLKHLTANQHVQAKLRSELRATFSEAHKQGRNPTAAEIAKTNVVYLDATIEEILRTANTASGNIRRATVDTEIYGIHIPKGTDVFMLINGPGFIDKPIAVDEKVRSTSSRESKDKNGMWEVSDIGTFMPERWLTKGGDGAVEFDARAGPAMPFGAGPRGCFGRKLASLELKIIITLIIWNFELQPTPPSLSSFRGQDKITHAPQQCYLRLAEVK